MLKNTNKYDEDSRLKEAVDPRFQSLIKCHENKKEELNGFSEYLSKYLNKYLERNLIEIELPSNKIQFHSKDDGIFLFSSSSQKISNESEDNEVKTHNYIYKRKKYESSDSESEAEKVKASAVSADWILNNSGIHKNSNAVVNIRHTSLPNHQPSEAHSKHVKHRSVKKCK